MGWLAECERQCSGAPTPYHNVLKPNTGPHHQPTHCPSFNCGRQPTSPAMVAVPGAVRSTFSTDFASVTDQPTPRFRILSIDGGGYLGLATAAFLQTVEAQFDAKTAECFDLFCGTSTGAILALAFATGMSAADTVALYKKLGPRIFPHGNVVTRNARKLGSLVTSRHGNHGLRIALKDAFGERTLADVHARGKFALVTAFNVTSGTPRIFKTDHAPELRAHAGYRLADIILASTAAPVYLPLATLTDPLLQSVEQFGDGGLVANSPALLGYAEAVSYLRRPPHTLDILSLSTPRVDHAERMSDWRMRIKDVVARGYWQWGFGPGLIARVMDGGSMVSDSALRLIAQSASARYHRVVLRKPNGVDLDVTTSRATQALVQLGVERARDSSTVTALTPFFR